MIECSVFDEQLLVWGAPTDLDWAGTELALVCEEDDEDLVAAVQQPDFMAAADDFFCAPRYGGFDFASMDVEHEFEPEPEPKLSWAALTHPGAAPDVVEYIDEPRTPTRAVEPLRISLRRIGKKVLLIPSPGYSILDGESPLTRNVRVHNSGVSIPMREFELLENAALAAGVDMDANRLIFIDCSVHLKACEFSGAGENKLYITPTGYTYECAITGEQTALSVAEVVGLAARRMKFIYFPALE